MFTFLCVLLSGPAPDPVGPLLSKHPAAVLGLAVSPDGAQLASLSRDGTILIWDVKTARELRRFKASSLGRALAWPQPEKLLAVGAMALDVMNPAMGKVLASHRVGQRSDAGAISADGRFAVVGNTHFTGMLLDVAAGKSFKRYPGPYESSYALDFSADNAMLAIGGRSPDPDAITLFETKDFTQLRRWNTSLKDAVGLRFAPNNQLLACSGDSDVVKLWNVADGSLAMSFRLAQSRAPTLAFSPDSRSLVVCSGVSAYQFSPHHYGYIPPEDAGRDKPAPVLQCWDLPNKRETWRSSVLSAWATSIQFLNDQRFVTGHYDGTLRFWDVPR